MLVGKGKGTLFAGITTPSQIPHQTSNHCMECHRHLRQLTVNSFSAEKGRVRAEYHQDSLPHQAEVPQTALTRQMSQTALAPFTTPKGPSLLYPSSEHTAQATSPPALEMLSEHLLQPFPPGGTPELSKRASASPQTRHFPLTMAVGTQVMSLCFPRTLHAQKHHQGYYQNPEAHIRLGRDLFLER